MSTTTYLNKKDIRLFPKVCVETNCIVSNTGLTADSNGKKIIPAGTPVGSTTNFFSNRQTVLSVQNSSTTGSNAVGVLLEDVDVTGGNENTSMLIAGFVDLLKIDVTIDSTAETALKSRITFMKGAE